MFMCGFVVRESRVIFGGLMMILGIESCNIWVACVISLFYYV
jgi:hypothetical protein